jgi:acetylornithine/N-succinyldiaminopimelate aminotransferase
MNLNDIIALDEQYYMNTFGKRTPAAFVSGKGSVLTDTEGRHYVDFLAGIAVNCLGYAHPALVEAIQGQAEKLLHTSSLFYIEPQAKLAAKIAELAGGDYKVFFGNSGAEANEGSFKLARLHGKAQNPEKYEIITALNSFHGRTLATLAATGQKKYQDPFTPLPDGFKQVPYGDLAAMEKAITDKTAAVMVETIQGEGGVIEGGAAYLKGLQKLCQDRGVLFMLDEVQTGIGRTGKMFSFEHYGLSPDVFSLAKGLGGGVPIGAVVAKASVADAFTPGNHGTTFGGNFLATAAGLAVLDELCKPGFLESVTEKGAYFKAGLQKLADGCPAAAAVRGTGLMLGLQLDPAVDGRAVVAKAFEKGYIINCAGGNTLRFVPPLIIEKAEIDGLLSVLGEILKEA